MPALAVRLGPLAYAVPAAALSALAVLGFQVHPLLPLVALGAVGVAVLAVARPLAAVMLGIAATPLALVALPLPGGAGLTPPEAIFLLAGFGWALRRLTERQPPWSPSPLGLPLLGLLLAVLPALAVAIEPAAVLKTFVMWAAFLLVFQLIITEADPAWIRRLLIVLALTGAVVGVIAAFGSGGQQQELVGLGTQATGRAAGSFGQPNLLATFLGFTLPAALALALVGPRSLRPLMVAAFVVAFLGLALSLSRGGLLAAAGALVVLLAWQPFRRAAAVALIVMIAVIAITGGSVFGPQFDIVTGRLQSVQYSAQGDDPRLALWRTAPEMIADQPVAGIGAANFSYAAPRYGLIDPLTDVPFDHAHNVALTVGVELGLVGLALFVWVFVALGVTLVRACRRTRGEQRGLAFAVTAAIVAFALQGLVDYTVRSNVVAVMFMTLAACAVVLARAQQSPSGPDAPPVAAHA